MLFAEDNASEGSNTSQELTDTGTTDTTQQSTQKSLELHAFYPAFTSYSPDLEKFIDRLDSVSFAWSSLYADSLDALATVKGVHNNTGFYFPNDYIQPIKYAKSKGKSIQLSVFAEWNDVKLILPYEDKRSITIQTIIRTLGQDITSGEAIYFDGVVIDFEGLRNTDSKGNDILFDKQHISDYFNRFLIDLNTELDKLNKKLYVAVNPRLYFNGYDYSEIIKTADKMIIMAHDYEPAVPLRKSEAVQYTGYNSLSPIDSLAPIKKIKQTLEYARNCVENPQDLNKIWLQLALYSAQWQFSISENRDWESLDGLSLSNGKRSKATYKMIKDRIDNLDGKGSNITYGYNNELQCAFMQYFNAAEKLHNVIIYEDSNSIKAKLDLAKTYGMGGISMWSLGNIPDYNDYNGKNFRLDVWENILNSIQAQGDSIQQSEKVQFADKVMEEAVRKLLGKLSGEIYLSDIRSIYRLKVPEGVSTLADLGMFENLEYLNAQNLTVKDITVLSKLTNLKVLYLQRNMISDISPLKALTGLQILSLKGNRISDINALSGLTELKELYLGENLISNITPLARMAKLGKLNLNSNKITKVSSLGQLKGLYELSFEGNLISDLKPLAGLVKLIYINGSNNKIIDISSLRKLKSLENVYLQRNQIKDVSAFKDLKEIRRLSLNGNQITDITPLCGLPRLAELYLKDNKIKCVSKLKSLKELNTLYLSGNKLIDLNAFKKNLYKLANSDFQ
jgi:internalin A